MYKCKRISPLLPHPSSTTPLLLPKKQIYLGAQWAMGYILLPLQKFLSLRENDNDSGRVGKKVIIEAKDKLLLYELTCIIIK